MECYSVNVKSNILHRGGAKWMVLIFCGDMF